MFLGFKCTRCSSKIEDEELVENGLCKRCGGTLLAIYDYSDVDVNRLDGGRPSEGVWKFRMILPSATTEISLSEGCTPLLKASRLSEKLGLRNILLKNECENPTGSFIDRGSAILVSKLVEKGIEGVYGFFKGNMGASLAAYCARAGLKCIALLKGPIDAAKLYQMIAYGAEVKIGEATRPNFKAYRASSADPYMLEGFKTIVYEIAMSLSWRMPNVIVVPIGSGSLATALWRGLKELKLLGFLEENNVRIIGVQPSFCAPVVEKFTGVKLPKRGDVVPELAFPNPERGEEALKAIKESRGAALTVSEDEMIEASKLLAKCEGIFAELAAASTIAALRRLVDEGLISRDEEAVCMVTGSGLKDPTAAVRELERNIALERVIKGLEKAKLRGVVGSTKVEILKILKEKNCHGYEIWKELSRRGLEISMPVVYQHLRELKSLGLIAVDRVAVVKNRRRVLFTLTKKGRELLAAFT